MGLSPVFGKARGEGPRDLVVAPLSERMSVPEEDGFVTVAEELVGAASKEDLPSA